MKIKEVSDMFNITMTKLRYYEKIGLFDDVKRVNGVREYEDKDIKLLSMIISLKNAGLSNDSIIKYMELSKQGNNANRERTNILKWQRPKLLDEIHEKQKNLDCLDYLIYELKNNEG
jgi:MerR family transcriptional regulator, aldehyde-responsive regulator